jgi:hypothetical protein
MLDHGDWQIPRILTAPHGCLERGMSMEPEVTEILIFEVAGQRHGLPVADVQELLPAMSGADKGASDFTLDALDDQRLLVQQEERLAKDDQPSAIIAHAEFASESWVDLQFPAAQVRPLTEEGVGQRFGGFKVHSSLLRGRPRTVQTNLLGS